MHKQTTDLCKVSQECNALHSFAQTHLISQNSIDALVVQVGQPIHALIDWENKVNAKTMQLTPLNKRCTKICDSIDLHIKA